MFVRILNRLFKIFKYRLYPISRFQLEVERLMRSGRKIKFIQVGANDGVRFDDLYFTATSNRWSGVVIEPMANMFKRLAMNYSDHPDIIPLNFAVHPTNPEAVVYHVADDKLLQYPDWVAGIASMQREHLERNNVNPQDIVEEKVRCVPLMEIVEEYRLKDADILQIDTEGFDAEIIKMIDFNNFKPRVIKYEHGHLSNGDHRAITNLLRIQGYEVQIDGAMDTVAVRRE